MMRYVKFLFIAVASLPQIVAFTTTPQVVRQPMVLKAIAAKDNTDSGLTKTTEKNFVAWKHQFVACMTALTTAALPVMAKAVEDDYEYGKVDAPIGLAIGVGILAIITAAVPVLLAPGEKAFEEIREREADTFGSRTNKSVLDSKKQKK